MFGLYVVGSTNQNSREYCESENFHARCRFNEVIVLQTALYGRMRIGRCVKADLGYLGCATDVRPLADKKCSGRRECDIRVPNSEFDATKPCFHELKIYLEASYKCVQGQIASHYITCYDIAFYNITFHNITCCSLFVIHH